MSCLRAFPAAGSQNVMTETPEETCFKEMLLRNLESREQVSNAGCGTSHESGVGLNSCW